MTAQRCADQVTSDPGALLETFLALVPDAAVVVDAGGEIVAVNEQACELFGHPVDAMVGRRIEMLVPERFRHRHRKHRETYADRPTTRTMGAGRDLTGRRADGTEFAIDISLAPIGLGDRPLVVAGVRDATERRAATAAQAQLAAIVESSLDGIVAISATGRVLSWNAGAARLFGHDAASMVGSHISRLVPPDQSVVFEELLGATLDGAEMAARDTEWQTADGRRLPVALSMSPLHGSGAEPIGLSLVIRDITERKRAESELRRQERWQAANAEIRLSALSGDPLEQTLDLVCERACDLVGVEAAIVVLAAPRVAVRGASQGCRSLVGATLDGSAHAIDASEPAGFELRLPAALRAVLGTRPLLSMVSTAGRQAGALIVGQPADASLSGPVDGILESFANQIAVALELDRSRRDAERLLLAEDRDRIARDLHDVVIQHLFASGMRLQGLLPLVSDERATQRISTVIDELDHAIAEIRTAVFSLGERGGRGVRADVIDIVDGATEQLGFRPGVRFEGAVDATVTGDIGVHVLAVLTEALSNVVRHASASSVQISLSVRDDVVLIVEDDGVGIGSTSRQSGLANLRRRAEALGGSLLIDAGTGAGTRLRWCVPVGDQIATGAGSTR